MFRSHGPGLFASIQFHDFSEKVRRAIVAEVDGIGPDRLLNSSTDDLVAYFEEKHRFEVPHLLEDRVEVSSEEADFDVSRRFEYGNFDRSGPLMVKGLAITYHVPFEGDVDCFMIHPTRSYVRKFDAEIVGRELRFRFQGPDPTAAGIKSQFEQEIRQYREMLDFLRNDLGGLNRQLGGNARGLIEQRKQKLLRDRNVTADLGVPVRARQDAPRTFAAPNVRRRISPALPAASSAAFNPEPVLATDDYDHILRVIQSTAHVMERSPQAFRTMDEETLRTHILVQLNGHFEGQATGETFNAAGKTDILIRSDDRNIFIAECKIWSGSDAFLNGIDQLLSYTAWRDTKTAIILFNRNKDFRSVLEKIDPSVRGHTSFKRALGQSGETSWRYVFGHRDDASRELFLAVLAFDVPTAN